MLPFIDTMCFTGKYTTRKIRTKRHPGPEWRIFHILTSEDIDDAISSLFMVVCSNNQCKMASDRFVKFPEADVRSFTEELQENFTRLKIIQGVPCVKKKGQKLRKFQPPSCKNLRYKSFSFVFCCLHNRKKITRWLEDINLIFSC